MKPKSADWSFAVSRSATCIGNALRQPRYESAKPVLARSRTRLACSSTANMQKVQS